MPQLDQRCYERKHDDDNTLAMDLGCPLDPSEDDPTFDEPDDDVFPHAISYEIQLQLKNVA